MRDLSLDHPDDRLGFSLRVSHSKTPDGFRGALVGLSGRWEWECICQPQHATRDEAVECARAEVRARRRKLGDRQAFSDR